MMRAIIFCVLMLLNAVGHANPLCDVEPCQLNAHFANGGELRVLGYALLVFGDGAAIDLGQDGYIDPGADGKASFDINARPLVIQAGDSLVLMESGKIRFGAQGGFGLGNGMIDVAPSGKLTIDSSSEMRVASHGSVYLSRIWNDGTTRIEATEVNLGAGALEQPVPVALANLEVIGRSLQSKIDIHAERAAYIGTIIDASAVLNPCAGGNACTPSNPPSTCTPPSSVPVPGGVVLTSNVSISTGSGAPPVINDSSITVCSGNGGSISPNARNGVIVMAEPAPVDAAPDTEAESAATGTGTVTLPVINLLVLLYLLRGRAQRLRRTAGEYVAHKKYAG